MGDADEQQRREDEEHDSTRLRGTVYDAAKVMLERLDASATCAEEPTATRVRVSVVGSNTGGYVR